jgi:hypothetical protein
MLAGLFAGMFVGCALPFVPGIAAAGPFAADGGLFFCTESGLSVRVG